MKTLKLLVGFLAAASSFVIMPYSQDYPPSFGPAPFADNIIPASEIFYGANPLSRAIICISTSTIAGQKQKHSLNTCTGPALGAPITYFPAAYTRVTPNRYYIIDQLGLRLLRMDSLGTETLMGSITGTPLGNLEGLTYNAQNGLFYIIASNFLASQIGILDTATRIIAPIGSPSTICAAGISASIAPQGGSLFAVDIAVDNLYRFNLTTGVPTLIGSLGVNADFGQDAQFDNDGTLYWAAYTTGPQLRIIDTATGSSYLLCSFTGMEATAIATIPASQTPLPTWNACRTNLNLPIPDNGTLRDSVIIAIGNACNVTDVNVRIVLVTHTWDSDLTFYIQHLTTGVKIINRVGGSGDNFINTLLDDQGIIPIASGIAPFSGIFTPSNPLAPFNGSLTDGVWRLLITDTAGGDTGILYAWCVVITFTCPVGGIQTLEIQNYYSLSQNYPNPFNPMTKIKYGLPENSNVKIVIYDILGREVKILVNEYRQANTYEVDFDASNYASGIYFYTLQTPNFTQTRKMLLIK